MLLQLLEHRKTFLRQPFAEQQRGELKSLSKQIWRRRRYLKRRSGLITMFDDIKAGRAPQNRNRGTHIDYRRLFKEEDPSEAITMYFKELFNVDEGMLTETQRLATERVTEWQRLKLSNPATKITEDMVRAAIKKLKPGKGSEDGITAEVLAALPAGAFRSFAEDVDRRCHNVDFDASITRAGAVLLPKIINAPSLDKFRPIASLSSTRKLYGYLWLHGLPNIKFASFQTAFVKGAHPLQGVYCLFLAAEKAREWGKPLYAAQIDLRKAFDHVDREAALRALQEHGVGPHLQAWIAKLWADHTLEMRLGCYRSARFSTTRGLPQGAPESPFVFTVLVDSILGRLNKKWEKRSTAGFRLDGWWLPSVAYADDILITAMTKAALEGMICDLTEEFAKAGLGIGHAKTNWSSTQQLPGESLVAGGVAIPWCSSFVFTGVEISLLGTSAPAIQHRMGAAQSTKSRWAPWLRCAWVPRARRIAMMQKAVWPSLLWGAAAWHPTRAWQQRLSSWGARVIAAVAGIRRAASEHIGDWWRRLHREGHALLEQHGCDPEKARRRVLHQWAGHAARMPAESPCGAALRTRGLQWWRYSQERHCCKHTGVHAKRFSCWRWEAQLGETYGDGNSNNISDNTGWLGLAQNREHWKQLGNAY